MLDLVREGGGRSPCGGPKRRRCSEQRQPTAVQAPVMVVEEKKEGREERVAARGRGGRGELGFGERGKERLQLLYRGELAWRGMAAGGGEATARLR